jgi:hypothetical protein
MKAFTCTAKIEDVHTGSQFLLKRDYNSVNLESAKSGFTSYLKDNKTIKSFSCVIVK